MIRKLALAAALAVSTCAVAETPLEAAVNARLDAQLHRTLRRLARRAPGTELASTAGETHALAPRRAR